MAFYTLCAITVPSILHLVKSCSYSSTTCYVYIKVIFHVVWKSNNSNSISSFAAHIARCVSYLSSHTLAILIGLVVEIVVDIIFLLQLSRLLSACAGVYAIFCNCSWHIYYCSDDSAKAVLQRTYFTSNY